MTTALALPRIALPMGLAVPALDSLASRLSTHLSYEHLRNQVSDFKLLAILDTLNLLPFNMEAVEKYKLKQLRKERTPYNAVPFLPNKMRWIRNNISHYKAPIPVHILEDVQRIVDATSRSSLSMIVGVDYLGTVNFESVERQRQRREEEKAAKLLRAQRLADPFIYLRAGGPLRYIHVWDEPTFFPDRMEL